MRDEEFEMPALKKEANQSNSVRERETSARPEANGPLLSERKEDDIVIENSSSRYEEKRDSRPEERHDSYHEKEVRNEDNYHDDHRYEDDKHNKFKDRKHDKDKHDVGPTDNYEPSKKAQIIGTVVIVVFTLLILFFLVRNFWAL